MRSCIIYHNLIYGYCIVGPFKQAMLCLENWKHKKESAGFLSLKLD